MKSKQEKRRVALKVLLTSLEVEKETLYRLQCQSYSLIGPSESHLRISDEVMALKIKLGQMQPEDCPF